MGRKLKILLASSLQNHPVLASIFLDGQALAENLSIGATTENFSVHEFDIAIGNHELVIKMNNDNMFSLVEDLNLIIGAMQLSKLDGTYHPSLYLVPSSGSNLQTTDDPALLVTKVLFYNTDELRFSFDSENPIIFRDLNGPQPIPPEDFVLATSQTPDQWVDGQILIYDELKYQYDINLGYWFLLI